MAGIGGKTSNGTSAPMNEALDGVADQTQHENFATNGTDNQTNEAQILSEYQKLTSRRVDLVGDYAGGELFLIEGDSMLLQCFDDDALDFQDGFQLLHAAYNVERLLQHLWQRKCNFKIVFFDCNSHLCVPKQATTDQKPRYFLARAAIIRHLTVELPKSHPSITIHNFESWKSPEFSQYLRDASPYFLMVHDGAQTGNAQLQGTTNDQENRLAFRSMILYFITCGYNIALINELSWQDTKILTTILESSRRNAFINLPDGYQPKLQTFATRNVSRQITQLKSSGIELSERHMLSVIVIASMIEECPGDISSQEWTDLCTSFLSHTALASHQPLSARRLSSVKPSELQQQFVSFLASRSIAILGDQSWSSEMAQMENGSGMADYIDGRLFLTTCHHQIRPEELVELTFNQLKSAVSVLLDSEIGSSRTNEVNSQPSVDVSKNTRKEGSVLSNTKILPFANDVFDNHLEIVKIKVDARNEGNQTVASQKIFQEVSHWHNASKSLVRKGPIVPPDPWLAKRALIRNQRYMAEMQKYAASLTNAVGRSLEPETIISKSSASAQKPTKALPVVATPPPATGKTGSKKGASTKTDSKNAKKNAMLAERALEQEKRVTNSKDKSLDGWIIVCNSITTAADPQRQYELARTYLGNLSSATREIIGAECELYMVNCLVTHWSSNEHRKLLHIAALIWHHISNVCERKELTKANHDFIQKVIDLSGLPKVSAKYQVVAGKPLSFVPDLRSIPSLPSNLTHREFLLLYCGPFLERSFDSKADTRVDFLPDAWQRDVLDSIDADRSVFVVAPTSAGKTFISFYAMRKVLEASEDGVLVYVAPTKALVNQIAAEIQARYSKSYKYGGKSVWAIHTRDHRINSPNGCQILVTVPHILQIMLLSPSNTTWATRIKRIIFDEIHSIGQAEDGLVWEQLLLMAPSPIIALSATVGNPDEFSDWLISTQSSIGIDLDVIVHPYRYSDLRKFCYNPPENFSFTGLSAKQPLSDTNLDGLAEMTYVHPISTLVDRSRGIPDDLALEPRDCLFLWRAMKKVEQAAFRVPDDLDPDVALPEMVRKQDVLAWEKQLMSVFRVWIDDRDSPLEPLLEELGNISSELNVKQSESKPEKMAPPSDQLTDNLDPLTSTLPLLCRLHEQNAMPAILFNYDRHQCERICKKLLDQLTDAERTQVKSGPKWDRTLEKWEEWKKLKERNTAKQAKESAKSSKRTEGGSDDADKLSKLAILQESGQPEDGKWEQFDPDQPLDGFHFADRSKLLQSELEQTIKELARFEINPTLIAALRRGVGVHHAGMNRKYRQVVEMLFRKRYLRVVVATGTLALGVNMPCKTVVFSGDSIFLTALNYRQCAGRAGRRGFDLLGNVVFQSVSKQKVCRLVSSRLPSLNGHFPITTSFVLRLFILLEESKHSKYAVAAVNSVLSQPRLYLGGDSFKQQTMHHLRFSIEYLRRQNLLSMKGTPLNFAGLVSHLYYTENSSFAFHALLREGFFNSICSSIDDEEENTLLTLMLVMANLFCRFPCKRSDKEFIDEVVKKSSSMVFLPPLPLAASKILDDHNKATQSVFEAYVRTYIDQHITANDDVLPMTNVKFGGDETAHSLPYLPPARVRSAFVALSGADDSFTSIHDLCSTVRSGVFLEEAVIPYIDTSSNIRGDLLNAWLLDFFKHGDVATLERDNGVKRSDVWFRLNDFSLVLATIVTSLTNFLGLDNGGEIDMSMLQGEKDAFDEAKEDEAEQMETGGEKPLGETNLNVKQPEKKSEPAAKVTKKLRAKVVDSWDDENEDDDDDDDEDDESLESTANNTDAASIGGSTLVDLTRDDNLRHVLKAFEALQVQFNQKFKAMWA